MFYKPERGAVTPLSTKRYKEMKKLVLIAMTVAILGIFNACEKSDDLIHKRIDVQSQEAVKPDVYSENGYLAFKNIEAVDSIIEMLSKMTTPEIEIWEKSMDIVSARNEFEELFSEYEKLNSYDEFLAFKNRNYEKLKFNDLDPEDNSIDYPYSTIHFLPGISLAENVKNKGILIQPFLPCHIP